MEMDSASCAVRFSSAIRPLYAIRMVPTEKTRTLWKLLLVLPYIGLCFPQMYAKATPELFGFPFFYWYQFMWVILTAGLLGLVYRKLKY